MSCDCFLERVDELLSGNLAGAARELLLGHLETCSECRDLAAALAAAPDATDPGLAETILARTSGAACSSAHARLCAWVDAELDAVDTELVGAHLRTCGACAGLARALRVLAEELPRLAEEDPGPRFVASVLSRTSQRPRPTPVRERLASALARLLGRPRIAWEGAFVATFVLLGPIVAPGLELARNPTPQQRLAWGDLRGRMDDLEASLVGGARSAWVDASVVIVDRTTSVGSGLALRSTSTLESIRRSFGTFAAPDASGQTDSGPGTIPDAAQEKR